MISRSVSEAACRLDGLLYATSSLSGELREYENAAFLVPIAGKSGSLLDHINSYFMGQYEFVFDTVDELSAGMREFEAAIRGYLIRDRTHLPADRIDDLRAYLSFRLMDMIDEAFREDFWRLQVFKAREEARLFGTDVTFFAVRSSRFLLVLQFNHYLDRGDPENPSG